MSVKQRCSTPPSSRYIAGILPVHVPPTPPHSLSIQKWMIVSSDMVCHMQSVRESAYTEREPSSGPCLFAMPPRLTLVSEEVVLAPRIFVRVDSIQFNYPHLYSIRENSHRSNGARFSHRLNGHG